MEFLSIFGFIIGMFLVVVFTVAAVVIPFYWIADRGEERFGFGVALAAGLTWMVLSGSVIISAAIYFLDR